jgi:sigma-B regulation protein RsbU (phosphoserine phosphatase)
MLTRSVLKGVLTVYNKKTGRGFTDDDQRLLAIIAAQSAQVVENARLYEEERSLFKIQQELKLASQIQADLLPKSPPTLAGYDIAGATFPARAIGGDYYDFIPLSETKVAVALGDVSGKGLTAALLMANLQASLRSHTYMANSVKDCVAKVNRHIFQSTSPEKFATLFYGILDTRTHALIYCNAGHEPPILINKDGEPARLKDGGTVIGIADSFEFQEVAVPLQVGDMLVAFSDGVTEAMSDEREQFGEQRLTNLLKQNVGAPSGKLVDEIVRAVKSHAGQAPQHDDITTIVLRRNQI